MRERDDQFALRVCAVKPRGFFLRIRVSSTRMRKSDICEMTPPSWLLGNAVTKLEHSRTANYVQCRLESLQPTADVLDPLWLQLQQFPQPSQ